MLYVRYDEDEGNRYLSFSKNRRGSNKIKQYYRLSNGRMQYIPRVTQNAFVAQEEIVSDRRPRDYRHSFLTR